MTRLSRVAASIGILGWIAMPAASADDWEALDSFADIAGYNHDPAIGVEQLAAVPGYGAIPLIARTDPTELLPTNEPGSDIARPLGLTDAQLYQQIFAAQEDGNLSIADGLMLQLSDRLLVGTVLQQRYMHPTAYRSTYDELAEWLRLYHDHAGADEIYDLAMRRRPDGAPLPAGPTADDSLNGYSSAAGNRPLPLPVDIARDGSGDQAARSLLRSVRRSLRDEDRAGALATLAGGRAGLSTAEAAQARGLIAFNAFLNSSDAESLEQAALAINAAGSAATDALWAGGLSAWRTGDYARAHIWFDALSQSPYASRWLTTAAAYWGARACLREHKPGDVSALLRRAAQHPDTFYGMLAQHALGMHDPRYWDEPHASDSAIQSLLSRPGATRGLALLQIGETDRGEAEFRALASTLTGDETRALLAFAGQSDMPGLALRLSIGHAARTGEQVWAARYPAPRWMPATGLQLDRATMLAIMRQESAFNPDATSSAGARGLMQLMPRTAQAMAQLVSSVSDDDLSDPASNMALGQQFIQELRSYSWIGDDMFKILAAYNGGPGNLQRWLERADFGDDPLLFIESIRAGETRDYVERVMANLWAYRLRFGQPTPELDDLVAGNWPRYQNLNASVGVAALPQ